MVNASLELFKEFNSDLASQSLYSVTKTLKNNCRFYEIITSLLY